MKFLRVLIDLVMYTRKGMFVSLSVPCEYMASFSPSPESIFKGGKIAILFGSAN